MADITALENRIRSLIKTNGNQEITGAVAQQILLDIADSINTYLEAEAQARQSGDSTLSDGINSEKQQRIEADTALGQRITVEIQAEKERAEAAFNDVDLIDSAGSELQQTQITLTLRKNDGSEQEPDWRTLAELVLPSATAQRAGLMSAADKITLDDSINTEEYNIVNSVVSKLSNQKLLDGRYSGSGQNIQSGGKHIVIPIKSGDKVEVQANSNYDATLLVLSSYTFNAPKPYIPQFATGESARSIAAGETLTFTAAENAEYLFIQAIDNANHVVLPQSVVINGLDYSSDLRTHLSNLKKNLEDLKEEDISYIKSSIYRLEKLNAYDGRYSTTAEKIQSGGKHIIIPIKGGDNINVKTNHDNVTPILVLSEYNYDEPMPYVPHYATGESARGIRVDSSESFVAPENATYLFIQIKNARDVNVSPQLVRINGVDYSSDLRDVVAGIKADVATINSQISAITTLINKGYVYRGIATPDMAVPSAFGKPFFYLATLAGTYTNLGGVSCEDGINIIATFDDGVSWFRTRFVGFESGRSDVPQLAKYATVYNLILKLNGADTVNILAESVSWNNGYLMKYNGIAEEQSARMYSSEVSVKKGDVLIIKTISGSISKNYPPYLVKRVEDDITTYLNDFTWDYPSSSWNHYYHIFEEDCTIVINTYDESHGYTYLYRGSVISQLYNNDVNNVNLQFNLYGLKKLPVVAKGIGSNNQWNTNSGYYVPVTPGDNITISLSSSTLVYAFLRSLHTIGSVSPDFAEDGRKTSTTTISVIVPDNANWLFIRVNGTEYLTKFTINGVSFIGNETNTLIENLGSNRTDSEEEVKLLNIVDPSTINHTDQEPQLVLLHFSDIHNDITRFKRVLDYYRKNAQYINDVLMSGDSAGAYYADFNRNILSLEDFDKVLMEIGNHDTYAPYGDGAPEGEAPTMQQLYETFLGQIANWGVVQPEGAGENDYYPCYYYKDYPACKMRLVVLDCMHWDMTQSDWFDGVIRETLDNTKDCYGYHVIGSQHYLSHDGLNNLTLFDTPFNSLDDYKLEAQSTIVGSVTVVDGFIRDGGIFVCWLGGHIHSDFCGLLTNHNNQIFINVGSASRITPAQDCARIEATSTQDLFNVIGFDFFSKTIKVMRVGATYDRYLRHRDTMCIKYGENPSLVYTS